MPSKKKILLINDKDYTITSGEVSCAVNYNEFFLPLREYFAEVHIVGRLNPSVGPYPFPVPGVCFHGVPSYRSYTDFFRRYRLGREGAVAREVLSRAIQDCDVVLLTVGCFFASDVEKICIQFRKPLIIEVIDDVFTAVTETRKYRGPLRWAALWAAWWGDRYYRRLCARYPSLILGKALYERYRPANGGRCIEFFENIMEEGQYSFGRKLFGAEAVRILFVGRLVHMKAVEDLVTALAELRDSGMNVECRIVGYGDCLDQIKRQVNDLGLADRVTFTGFVRYGDEMFSVYDWADVFVLPSVGGEGVPRVLVEALGRGCLVVATDVCGVSTIIKHHVTGILVPPRQPGTIAAAIRRFREDPQAVTDVLSGAREFCLRHTRQRQVKRLVDFVELATEEQS